MQPILTESKDVREIDGLFHDTDLTTKTSPQRKERGLEEKEQDALWGISWWSAVFFMGAKKKFQ